MADITSDSLSKKLLEVQRSLGWMDIVLGSITDAVYVTDKNQRLIFANQSFSNLLRVPRVFLLGKNLDDVFSPQLKPDPQMEFLTNPGIPEANSATGANVYKWAQDDQQYIFKISYRIIPTTRQTVYIAKDITEEYELSFIKSNFINIASHQLRTPMTAIMTYAHMLHDGMGGALDTNQKKLTKTIVSSSERMIELINDILLITRIQNGDTNLLAKDGLLIDVLVAVESEQQNKIQKKKLHFVKVYGKGIQKITCNTFVTQEIVSNLIANAVQYTPEDGYISIKVKLQNGQVVIVISDNGIGVPAKDIPTIFDQFSRAHNAFEVFNEGTGLGLYIVKTLIKQAKGTITCDSELNKGTTFKVTFPV
ncbi:MAG: sensor histidine kinase [Candidatus Saccharimonadales bacterium]